MYKVIKIINRVIGVVALLLFITMLAILFFNVSEMLASTPNVKDGLTHLSRIAIEFVKSIVLLGGIV